jgi:hypothetical protein
LHCQSLHGRSSFVDARSFEFIPRLTFMLSTFGYMIFLIIYKFTVDW